MTLRKQAQSRFTIEIASVPDRDYVVAEIWLEEGMFAELRYENGFHLQLYATPGGEPWDFPYDEVIGMLQAAKEKLGAPIKTLN